MSYTTTSQVRWFVPIVLLCAVLVPARPAGSLVTDFSAVFTPDPASAASTVTVAATCTFSDTETFVAASLTLGATIALSPVGSPVPVSGGLLRQDLTGSFVAPVTPGSFDVGYRCQTSSADRIGVVGALTVVTAQPTSTTSTTSTTTVGPTAPSSSTPLPTSTAAPRTAAQIRFTG